MSLSHIASQYDLEIDSIRTAVLLLVSYPIAYLQGTLKTPLNKHLVSIICTCFLILWAFDISTFIQILFDVLAIYLFTKYHLPASFSFLLIFIHLSYVQAKVQIWPSSDFPDFSSLIMVMIIKLTSFAFNVQDGRINKKMDQYQLEHSIKELPSFIEYLGYAFNISGMWVGPGLEFNHYRAFANGLEPYVNPPSTFVPALKTLGAGIGMMAIYSKFEDQFHFKHCSSSFFLNYSFWQKILYIMVSGIVVRAKYHGAWKISESIALTSGIGYGKRDGKDVFNMAENVNILRVEFGENTKACMDAWNKYTGIQLITLANWLRRYVYVRVQIPVLKLPITFFVSAFWHGFYPGYYTTFLSSVFLTEAARIMRKTFRPIFLSGPFAKYKFIYDQVGRLASMFTLNYLVVSFILRKLDKVLVAWSSIYFIGHVLFFTPILLNSLGLFWYFRQLHPKVKNN